MAIRRCPYCKAIIDEGSEYCSNCGTQLIFPEDEFAEEEIPGEKVESEPDEDLETEEEEEPEDTLGPLETGKLQDQEAEAATSEESEESGTPLAEAEGVTPDEPEESPEIRAGADLLPLDEEEMKEDEDVDASEKSGFKGEDLDREEKREAEEKEEIEEQPAGKAFSDYFSESGTDESLEGDLPGEDEDIVREEDVEEDEEDDYEEPDEIPLESKRIDFKTEDLESIVDPAEKEKEEIERFLDSLKEEREKAKRIYDETGELPPWAASMKESASPGISFEEDEERFEDPSAAESTMPHMAELREGEKVSHEARSYLEEATPVVEKFMTTKDTGMGLPEKVEQQDLPFGQRQQREELHEEPEFRDRKPEMKFRPWMKSRVFDVLLIAGLWLITVWLASLVAGVSFLRLISASTLPVLIFLAILFFIYFFLFFFFLGETLGDHLFSQEE